MKMAQSISSKPYWKIGTPTRKCNNLTSHLATRIPHYREEVNCNSRDVAIIAFWGKVNKVIPSRTRLSKGKGYQVSTFNFRILNFSFQMSTLPS